MSFSKIISVSSLLLVSTVHSHSWLHCSDYTKVILGQDYDEQYCDGYIREFGTTWGAPAFSVDRGINFQASSGDYCQGSTYTGNVDSWYSAAYPYAQWEYDRTVTLVWPAKVHANYECFMGVPDTSMKLYKNPTVNPTSELTDCCDDWDLLVDWHDGCTPGTDGCGFQNCPDFCNNTDAAPCFGTYTVSDNDFPTAGVYTLMWYWIYNAGTTPYTTCFEVEITGEYYVDVDTIDPTTQPSLVPTGPSLEPSVFPTRLPTSVPSRMPTIISTDDPTNVPTNIPTNIPSTVPSLVPSNQPTILVMSTDGPTDGPSQVPTQDPTQVSTQVFSQVSTQVSLETTQNNLQNQSTGGVNVANMTSSGAGGGSGNGDSGVVVPDSNTSGVNSVFMNDLYQIIMASVAAVAGVSLLFW